MARPYKHMHAATIAADRTVADLVAFLRETADAGAMPRETALSVAGAWRRLVQHSHPDGWADMPLGTLDMTALLERFGHETGVSESTVASMRSRIPKGLEAYETALRGQAIAAAAAAVDAQPDSSLQVRPGWTFELFLPKDPTDREIALIISAVRLFERGDDTTSRSPQTLTVSLRPSRTFTLELPSDYTDRELTRIVKLIELHRPDDGDPPG